MKLYLSFLIGLSFSLGLYISLDLDLLECVLVGWGGALVAELSYKFLSWRGF